MLTRLSTPVLLIVLWAGSAAAAEPAGCTSKDGAEVCKQKCDAGSQESCAVLGIIHLRANDFAKADPLLRRACDAKVPLGCGGLGSLIGVQGDPKKARQLFEKACKMKDALSCESLGGMTMGGNGTPPKDPTAAARKANVYYKRACELGSGTACGFCAAFIVDKIVKGTAKEALDLYVKACSGGMAIACRQGAELLVKDTPESLALAATYDSRRLTADLLKRACELGDSKACPRTTAGK